MMKRTKSARIPKKISKLIRILLLAVGALLLCAVTAVLIVIFTAKINPVGLFSEAQDESRQNTDVVYKVVDDRELKLDIYYPRKKVFTKAPVIFYFHGGGWNSGDKALKANEAIDAILDYGIALVSVEYRLTDENNTYPAQVDDSADAVRYIAKNAGAYGFDKNRFCVLGASAGGHISLLLLLDGARYGSDPELADTPFRVKCGVALCAPTDFLNLDVYENPDDRQEAAELLVELFGGTEEAMPEVYKDASPIYHVNSAAPPLFMVHGTRDAVVPYAQAQAFFEAAQKAGMKIKFVKVENGTHKLKPADGTVTNPSLDEVLGELTAFLIRKLIF